MANPLVNELVIGLNDKDAWNRRHPSQDGDLLRYTFYPTFPQILNTLFLSAIQTLNSSLITIAPTNRPRQDLIYTFLTGIPGLNQLPSTNLVELLRLNTSLKPVAFNKQNSLGVIAGDNAGYPNGRRPGDDVIDITLRVSMGVLCTINLGCTPNEAPVGGVQFTDGSPSSGTDFGTKFPYFNAPLPGSVDVPCSSIAC